MEKLKRIASNGLLKENPTFKLVLVQRNRYGACGNLRFDMF